MKYEQHATGRGGWTGWIYPRPHLYRMRCCDCGLVHDMQFRSVAGEVAFKARRNEKLTNDSRKEQEREKTEAKVAEQAREAQKMRKESPGSRQKVAEKVKIQAPWKVVRCPKCHAGKGVRCFSGRHIHTERVTAGKRLLSRANNYTGHKRKP